MTEKLQKTCVFLNIYIYNHFITIALTDFSHIANTGLQIFSHKCPLFGVWLISPNFGWLIPNPNSVFGCLVRISQCCHYSAFRARKSNFRKFSQDFLKMSSIFLKTIKLLTIWKKNLEIGSLVQEILLAKVQKTTKFENFWNFSKNFSP